MNIEVGNNNNNNNSSDNPEHLQRQREIFDAAQKRARSATNILKSMSDLRDTGQLKLMNLLLTWFSDFAKWFSQCLSISPNDLQTPSAIS